MWDRASARPRLNECSTQVLTQNLCFTTGDYKRYILHWKLWGKTLDKLKDIDVWLIATSFKCKLPITIKYHKVLFGILCLCKYFGISYAIWLPYDRPLGMKVKCAYLMASVKGWPLMKWPWLSHHYDNIQMLMHIKFCNVELPTNLMLAYENRPKSFTLT